MNWKALLLLCLVFFATTSVIGTALTSLISTPKTTSLSEKAVYFETPVESLGDEVDDKYAPK